MTDWPKNPDDHPAFPKPPPGAPIWRYMDWDPKFISLVEEQRLWMSSLPMLQDKFEGTTPTKITEGLAKAASKMSSDAERANLEDSIRKIRQFAAYFHQHYYVSCWTMNEREKDVLWNAYTTTYRSVAIQTTTDNLRLALPNYVDIGLVRYIDYDKDGFPTENLLHWPMHKRLNFDDEREVRALASSMTLTEFGGDELRSNIFVSNDPDKPNRIYAPPVKLALLIEAIYLHPRADDAFIAEAIQFCRSNGLPAPRISVLAAAGTF